MKKLNLNYYSDIDHLILFNKNGLWNQEDFKNKQRIISAEKLEKNNLSKLNIYHLSLNSKLIEKIVGSLFQKKKWELYNKQLFSLLQKWNS